MTTPRRPTPFDNTLPSWLTLGKNGACLVAVHAQPGAKKSAVKGEHGDRLNIALNAPPVDGKANAALCGFLAERLGISKSSVRLAAGEKSREKRLEVVGVSVDALLAALKTE